MGSTFRSLCRANDIGANCYALDFEPTRVVVDCGMHPKIEGRDSLARLDVLDDEDIDAFFLSHSHLDHVGGLPVFQREHPEAQVFMTEQTGALADALLHNSVNVMGKKRDELGLPEYPFFSHKEVEQCQSAWRYQGLRSRFGLPSLDGQEGLSATFYDAGHILGAVGLRIDCPEGSVMYTGDVNFDGQTIMRPADFPRGHIDTLIMETTRGALAGNPQYSREAEKQRLGQAITAAFERGGAALIPVFAIGKTQELLVMLDELRRDGVLAERVPVFIGGLSTKMTKIYDDLAGHSRRHYKEMRLLESEQVRVATRKKGKQLTEWNPRCIYALSSGMMTEKTVSNGFARHFIDDDRNALLFVGYADPESPAGKILAAQTGEKIVLDSKEPAVELNCEVERFDFSGHAPREQLLDYATELSPSRIFLVHGDESALAWFQQALKEKLPDCEVIVPQPEERYALFS